MANKIARIIFGIVLVVGLVIGIYFVLPGRYKNPITAKLQSSTDANYNLIINKVKATTVPKNKKKTYDAVMNKATKDFAWTIKKVAVNDAGDGTYEVYGDGYDTDISYQDNMSDDNIINHTKAHVRIMFKVEKKGTELTVDKKEVKAGEKLYPYKIEVDTYSFYKSDKTTYYQDILNGLSKAVN